MGKTITFVGIIEGMSHHNQLCIHMCRLPAWIQLALQVSAMCLDLF